VVSISLSVHKFFSSVKLTYNNIIQIIYYDQNEAAKGHLVGLRNIEAFFSMFHYHLSLRWLEFFLKIEKVSQNEGGFDHHLTPPPSPESTPEYRKNPEPKAKVEK